MKSLILSLLLVAVLSASCPEYLCVCRGVDPSACTQCYDGFKNISTNCQTCLSGYTIDFSTGMCMSSTITTQSSSCPVNCYCNTTVCGHCKDPLRSTSSNCTQCRDGYVNINSICIALPCPSLCECYGVNPSVCSACTDPRRNLSTSCAACSSDFMLAENGSCVQKPACPSGCSCRVTPGVCSSCRDPYKTLSSNCTKCSTGYELVLGATQCTALKSCPDLCWCLGSNPTVCTRCKDVNRNVSTVCRACNSGWLWLSDFQLCIVNNGSLPITQNTNSSQVCPANCFCDASFKCQTCTLPFRDPAYNCTGCIANYRIVDGVCRPFCVPGCVCQTVCVSCINPNYGIESDCVCPKRQKVNQYGVCV